EIETDKATMEVESPASGVLRRLLAAPDTLVAIRTPIAIIAAADESIEELAGAPANGGVAGQAATTGVPTSDLLARDLPPAKAPAAARAPILISPRARRRADEQGVPIFALAGLGTGPQGRIVERDVAAYVERSAAQIDGAAGPRAAARATPLAARMADDLGVDLNSLALGLPGSRVRSEDVRRHAESAPAAQPAESAGAAVIPLGGIRKRIAENVVKSAFTAPHVTLTLEVDMTACAEFRAQALPAVEKANGVRLSYTDILVKAAARALTEHPLLNATLAGDEIRLLADKNIGVAVALDEGLIVPVIKAADQKGLGAISAELKQLVERARAGRFTPDDLAGGTFTITNLGAFGIDVFDPIIVAGQAAILGVGRIADKPVVVNKAVTVRSMMNLCLSFDHRILDGAPAARFLQRLKELLENPLLVVL
ncbi:MAG TPA: dihydrolipoamide acetyltransferase family protein, partial [Chthonomonadaceae bacterium]|nr:dihydrolipoamide acetyltransferase family protein [Chthonomonadaceae bacterium]